MVVSRVSLPTLHRTHFSEVFAPTTSTKMVLLRVACDICVTKSRNLLSAFAWSGLSAAFDTVDLSPGSIFCSLGFQDIILAWFFFCNSSCFLSFFLAGSSSSAQLVNVDVGVASVLIHGDFIHCLGFQYLVYADNVPIYV